MICPRCDLGEIRSGTCGWCEYRVEAECCCGGELAGPEVKHGPGACRDGNYTTANVYSRTEPQDGADSMYAVSVKPPLRTLCNWTVGHGAQVVPAATTPLPRGHYTYRVAKRDVKAGELLTTADVEPDALTAAREEGRREERERWREEARNQLRKAEEKRSHHRRFLTDDSDPLRADIVKALTGEINGLRFLLGAMAASVAADEADV